ncbi:MAG: leucyl/phenylalanyl-tRNA--protein transferase [Nitrospirae bacterium CG18_big_fil_WC_8_21_14_2_50_70_55]|nr:leucyl/phenylalanyl-tRNA--protein transferase [Deltaproteobacteria bacterium]OIP62693.1 MAG: leucyl/phenylalanyl-tRNA--protein transferase [Nitrospirae bacterium CG2_30_70_394]PIQ03834.1 MAG: leucyl/phenylalanyl-tRNA--protein transferase [Nitrospirae bacterium CG18_big_fil_WC_8_21_14_2_50_70_55]PIU80191.1 MAG: leucyl/phenylalanyl-tRNA--protein transferase [Nitrospirae bacterium CG06_land_8_20_14_3_00_70_43]PIW83337.1 MAG: leucyl/phenylalanyl-tRNA--protein transferase [Nitrospirae bacterium C
MGVFLLDPDDPTFPPAGGATAEGLLAIGGDLSRPRLLEAYRHGIFPWYSGDQPLLWWSPDPRALLVPGEMRLCRSLAKRIRNGGFTVTADTCFRAVMAGCAAPRLDDPEGGTWITAAMVEAYGALFDAGDAHSLEVWRDGCLAGGLYGVAVGAAFCGESMFSVERDASKVALATLAAQLRCWSFHFIDCQLPTPHLASLGVQAVPRCDFLKRLAAAVAAPGHPGRWQLDPGLDPLV